MTITRITELKKLRNGLDGEFHMRRIKYLFETLRIKKCGI